MHSTTNKMSTHPQPQADPRALAMGCGTGTGRMDWHSLALAPARPQDQQCTPTTGMQDQTNQACRVRVGVARRALCGREMVGWSHLAHGLAGDGHEYGV